MSDSTAVFEAQRDRLRAVAYRMLGSYADAEDVVQEAWLRFSRQDTATIHNLAGWLTTVVGRISLDVLRSRQARPEAAYGELVVTVDDGAAPEQDAELADSVGLALLVVLESLKPTERLAFVLHDLFAVPFDDIGQILGKSADATKMLASRARRKVQATEPPASGPEQRAVVQAFLTAARDGDFDGLLRVLHPDVKLTAESADGTYVVIGATKVATGAQRVRTGTIGFWRTALVNGRPGLVTWDDEKSPLGITAYTVVDGLITEISILTDPARLAAVDLPEPD
ncbi:sigma-70 family RNA polymerase sigma factor [Fodinicola acaciae]|uniref:sigma-70 family RNA polymerase sigma factor n=1 Tax=Fodinicola acaciae TaxID=2681555 RepID=UPI0013D111C5|nr:sigma-70 family RNA polymerase sigma factor [Fodinicola acaciae]